MDIEFLDGKTILVTGGTGSFGSRFVKHLLCNSKAKKIIVLSRDELKQSRMSQECSDDRLRFFLGDVRELSRLRRAFNDVDIVVHAAALKQVPTLEYNPYEAVKTNIIGSQNVIDAAIDNGVSKVLLVSTDKAVQPLNLYGSTKLCAEKLFINGNSYSPDTTQFSCVRYGNVIGSRGSIVETLLMNKQVERVTLTDERMTRFWITYEQTFELVLYALRNMAGGEIFVPKIPSMRIYDLFDAIVPEAKKEIIGIRPGEKLHEILLTTEEARHAVELEKYYVVLPEDTQIFNKGRFAWVIDQAKPLDSDFAFMSHTNTDWLEKDAALILIQQNEQI